MEKRTAKFGLYTFEYDTCLIGSVKITNTDGRSFYLMGSALKAFLADLLRTHNVAAAINASDKDVVGF